MLVGYLNKSKFLQSVLIEIILLLHKLLTLFLLLLFLSFIRLVTTIGQPDHADRRLDLILQISVILAGKRVCLGLLRNIYKC